LTVNHNQRLRRARPVVALAAVAFVIGALVGASHGSSPEVALAKRFTAAWARGDYATMYSEIAPVAQRRISAGDFRADYLQASRTATAERLRVTGRPRMHGNGTVTVPVRVRTRLWGSLSLTLTLRTASEAGQTDVDWRSSMVFPGLEPGQQLHRRISLPRRATILARDGSVLAESPPQGQSGRSAPLGELVSAVLGSVGPIPESRRQALEAEGVPSDASVGVSGLELAFDDRLRGRPGGELVAGEHVLAYTAPRPAKELRTTISPSVQSAAVSALGGQLGGIVAMVPATGEILAVAGIGLDGLQPPGSTFKILTLTGALTAHLATPKTVFPYATYATLDGVRLNNANGEDCGGSLELAFAVSCNSVFTPLGVKIGAARLVATAERFGFNHDPGVPGAAESTLPAASEIQGELDVGSTAIGQGQVLATPLQMLTVAATIADGGHRPQAGFLPTKKGRDGKQATSPAVARTVRHLMTEVVREGTGRSAAIPGVTVAGKTGTAELNSECKPSSTEVGAETSEQEPSSGESCQESEPKGANTDAWFTAFAPALDPRIAVCVMLVKDGAGGDTAAPVARQVLEAGLKAGH
jgi:peptidoglycan glycosyltransferase